MKLMAGPAATTTITTTTTTTTTTGDRYDGPISSRWLAGVLVLAVLVELAVLRVGTRTAIHIPDIESVAGPLTIAAAAGRLAFYCSVVVLVALLVTIARDLLESGERHFAAAVAAFMLVSAIGAAGFGGNDVMAPVVAAVVIGLAAADFGRRSGPAKAAIGLFVTTYIVAVVPGLAPVGSAEMLGLGAAAVAQAVELLAAVTVIAIGPLVRRALNLGMLPSRKVLAVCGGVGLVAGVIFLANPSTVRILMLWNLGVTGGLPAPVYGAAAASLALGLNAAFRHDRAMAYGMALVGLGGIGMTNTYQTGLVVAGLALLNATSISSIGRRRRLPDRGRCGRRRHRFRPAGSDPMT